MSAPAENSGDLVILGVAKSDAHAVANKLIELQLADHGYTVVNLGVCTPLDDFADALAEHPGALALLIGSLNGHAAQDLRDLPDLRRAGRIRCPVVVGGNLSVGSAKKTEEIHARLAGLGVDHIVEDPAALPELLAELASVRDRIPAARHG